MPLSTCLTTVMGCRATPLRIRHSIWTVAAGREVDVLAGRLRDQDRAVLDQVLDAAVQLALDVGDAERDRAR